MHTQFGFYTICNDEAEWRSRHEKRIENPTPNQIFKSFEHVIEYYKNKDCKPFPDEYVIDTSYPLDKCIEEIEKILLSPRELKFLQLTPH